MSRVTSQISISLDGYAAGPDQSAEDPLGKGGERLHEWVVATESWRAEHGQEGGERNADSDVAAKLLLDDAGDPQLEPMEVVASPAVTHISYRVGRA